MNKTVSIFWKFIHRQVFTLVSLHGARISYTGELQTQTE